MNDALKTKWTWGFIEKDDVLWRKVIASKYGLDNLGWWSKKSPYAQGVGCWKSILVVLELFKTSVHLKVRNGSMMLLWQDVWCGDCPLKAQFPNLLEWLVSKMQWCMKLSVGRGIDPLEPIFFEKP